MTISDFIKEKKSLMVAAAGHGKTHTIAECVLLSPDDQCQLILTHTHAGIASIKAKMTNLNVNSNKYHIETIDSFFQQYVLAYTNKDLLPDQSDSKTFFTVVMEKAGKLFSNPHILDVVGFTYNALYVDEYQDCSKLQHALIMKLSKVLPVHLFGDELQGIFDFNEKVIDFGIDLAEFVKFDLLKTPWRWNKDGNCKELGNKILSYREILLSENKRVKLENVLVAHINFLLSDFEANDFNKDYYRLLGNIVKQYDSESLLIIFPTYHDGVRLRGDINDRLRCKEFFDFGNRFMLLEAIDDKDFYSKSKTIDELIHGISRARTKEKKIYDLLSKLSFNKTELNEWFDRNKACRLRIRQKENRVKSDKLAVLFREFVDNPTKEGVSRLISFFQQEAEMRPKRREVMNSIQYCLQHYPEEVTVFESMKALRNTIRRSGRKVQGRCIGTTLLTKGLEFDNVIVLDAHRFTDAKNFYVAISRACKNLVIVSKKETLFFEK